MVDIGIFWGWMGKKEENLRFGLLCFIVRWYVVLNFEILRFKFVLESFYLFVVFFKVFIWCFLCFWSVMEFIVIVVLFLRIDYCNYDYIVFRIYLFIYLNIEWVDIIVWGIKRGIGDKVLNKIVMVLVMDWTCFFKFYK